MSLADLFGDDGFLADSPFSLMRYRNFGLVNWFILQRDYLDYVWGTWVLGYDRQQAGFLERLLGRVDALRLGLMFLAAMQELEKVEVTTPEQNLQAAVVYLGMGQCRRHL